MPAEKLFLPTLLVSVLAFAGCDSATTPVKQIPKAQPETKSTEPTTWSAVSLETAGDRAAAMKDSASAVDFYRRAVLASGNPSKTLLDKLGQQWVNVGRPFEAVEVLETAIETFPDDAEFRQKMVSLLSSLGMQWESAVHLKWLIQRGHGNLNLLIIAAELNRPQTVESMCEYALKHSPDDLRPHYSIASVRAAYGQWQEVAEQLKSVVKQHPEFVPANAFYLRAIVELQQQSEIETLVATLPESIQSHPQYWLAAGIRAEQRRDTQQAAAAYWQATTLNENDGEALTRLSSLLAELGKVEASQAAASRSANITALRDEIDSLRSWRNDSQSAAVKIAKILNELGRVWEATAWLQAGFAMRQNQDPSIREVYQQTRAKLTGSTPWQLPGFLVANRFDALDSPKVDWQSNVAMSVGDRFATSSSIRLQDIASKVGLKHVCAIRPNETQESGLAIYQSGAGGVGVIDFDLDGWPDVYLTAMDGTPKQTNSAPNRLFRNQGDQFMDVTPIAEVGDTGFAQGVAVGDYDNDGWPDLLVANIGRNRLFRNNGDGTFTDVTGPCGLQGNDWTTSVAIADIDGDSHADIIEVGYCGGDFVYQHECIDQELNAPRSCSPLAFEAQRDRVWRGLGDGQFADASDAWLGAHEPGRGFGLVVGQLDAAEGIDVYIANDMTANHYWTVATQRPDAPFQLSQQATLRGLAVNERSLSQASMGVAAADADQDGDLDFLLTHFSDDYNTYYEQISDGLWSDRSRRVKLAQPSQAMLAYGTQWIDLDNSGSLELFIANGDIDDFSHTGRKFRQPMQVFIRTTDGRYSELPRASLGEYFLQDHLGRAVVTLDANRDGLSDILVTNLFEPIALLHNQTPDPGRSIGFVLRGTKSNRDAIGCRVMIEMDDVTQTGFRLAGNGYQCSSEGSVNFGVGSAKTVDRVIVEWPDGDQSIMNKLPSDSDYLIIQGATDAFELRRP